MLSGITTTTATENEDSIINKNDTAKYQDKSFLDPYISDKEIKQRIVKLSKKANTNYIIELIKMAIRKCIVKITDKKHNFLTDKKLRLMEPRQLVDIIEAYSQDIFEKEEIKAILIELRSVFTETPSSPEEDNLDLESKQEKRTPGEKNSDEKSSLIRKRNVVLEYLKAIDLRMYELAIKKINEQNNGNNNKYSNFINLHKKTGGMCLSEIYKIIEDLKFKNSLESLSQMFKEERFENESEALKTSSVELLKENEALKNELAETKVQNEILKNELVGTKAQNENLMNSLNSFLLLQQAYQNLVPAVLNSNPMSGFGAFPYFNGPTINPIFNLYPTLPADILNQGARPIINPPTTIPTTINSTSNVYPNNNVTPNQAPVIPSQRTERPQPIEPLFTTEFMPSYNNESSERKRKREEAAKRNNFFAEFKTRLNNPSAP